MYDSGRPPAFLLGRSGLAGLGDAETATECPQPVSTQERDTLRDEIGRYTSDRGDYSQWHEGHPDLIVALGDIGGRLRGLYDRPKLLRCEKEARDRAQIWIGQLRDLLNKVKSAPNRGWDASGYTAVNNTFQWSLHRGPTYTIRSTQDPGVNCTMQKWAASVWGLDAFPAAATCGQTAGQTQSSAPPGTVVTGGRGGQQMLTEPGAVVPTSGGPSGFLPSSLAPALEGSIGGIPTRYLVYGFLGLLAWRMVR